MVWATRLMRQPGCPVGREAQRSRALAPLGQQLRGRDVVVLGLSRAHRRDLTRGCAPLTALAQIEVDLVASAAEGIQHRLRDPADVGDAVPRPLPPDAKIA